MLPPSRQRQRDRLVVECLPYKHSSFELFDGTFDMLASDDCIVPVTTVSWLIIIIIDQHTTANCDVGNVEFVTSTRTNMPRRYVYRVTVFISEQQIQTIYTEHKHDIDVLLMWDITCRQWT